MKDLCVIILAAGEGTRMKSERPKVLHEICGKSMLSHTIKEALKISDNVIVVLGHKIELVRQSILAEFSNECEDAKISIVEQDRVNFPGTAGGVMAALNAIKHENCVISCGDMPLVSADELLDLACNLAQNDAVVGGFELENPFGYGRIITQNEKVLKIVEQKDASESEKAVKLCNSGAYALKTRVLQKYLPKIDNKNASKEYYFTDIIALSIANDESLGFATLDSVNFMGVNDKAALAFAEEKMLEKIREKWMKNGVIMHLPNTIYIDVLTTFEGECEIESNCVIKGKSVIKNSVIKSGSVIENSVVENSDVGPNAHLRPNSQIKGTHIGNFVELKNAKLDGVKAGHLTYLGDCEIESGTNIGCGTITCNYDGIKKYKTKIGKNVFVGSDTSFVAPVEIADNCIIAAGSVVTKNGKEGDLIITRAKQQNIAGYFEQKFGKK